MPTGFEQEPYPLLGFVDPILDQARRRNIAQFTDKIVHFAKAAGEVGIVFFELCQAMMIPVEGVERKSPA